MQLNHKIKRVISDTKLLTGLLRLIKLVSAFQLQPCSNVSMHSLPSGISCMVSRHLLHLTVFITATTYRGISNHIYHWTVCTHICKPSLNGWQPQWHSCYFVNIGSTSDIFTTLLCNNHFFQSQKSRDLGAKKRGCYSYTSVARTIWLRSYNRYCRYRYDLFTKAVVKKKWYDRISLVYHTIWSRPFTYKFAVICGVFGYSIIAVSEIFNYTVLNAAFSSIKRLLVVIGLGLSWVLGD